MTEVNDIALFEAWEAAGSKVASVDEAAEAIVTALGKGPFIWKGKEITFVKRGLSYHARVRAKVAQEIGK